MPESTGEGTAFLYPFIEGDERDAGSLLVDLGRSAVAKAETSAALRAVTLARTATRSPRQPTPWPKRSTEAGDCSPSATAAARPTRRRSPRCSPDRHAAAPSRRAVSSTTRRCSRRWATTSGSTWCSPASSSPTPRRATSRWASRPAGTRATSSPPSPRPAPARLVTIGLAGYDGGEMGGLARRAALPRRAVRQRAPDPGGPGRLGLRSLGGGAAAPRPNPVGGDRWLTSGDREAAGARPHRGLPAATRHD